MYTVTFAYPTAPGGEFDLPHYIATHLPLGAGLAKKFASMDIGKIVLQKIFSPDEGGVDQPYYLLCHIPFGDKAELDSFLTLFDVPEATQRLSDDWPKYTPLPPRTFISEVLPMTEMDEMRAPFTTVLEAEYSAEAVA